jgi:NitT/TauT family transport system substrate-binding protein
MITRRQSILGIGSFTLFGAVRSGFAQDKKRFLVTNPNGATDATQCFSTCGREPRLGYYALEGIEREQLAVNSLIQGMVAISQGQADAGSVVPPLFLPALAKEPNFGVIAVYNWLPRTTSVVVVRADSEIKSIADLAGKRIGIRNQGDGSSAIIEIAFADLGLKPDYQLIAIGDVGMAGNALERKNVDAMVAYDTITGRIEALGFKLRYLPMTASFAKGATTWYAIRKKDLKENRKSVIGFLRGTAKSTLFAHHNLVAAIKLHWLVFPESKPKTKSDEEALKELEIIMKDRRNAWVRRPDDPEQRLGATSSEDWASALRAAVTGTNNSDLASQMGEGSKVFTNELIDEVNDFDKAAVIKQAKEFRI